MMRWRTRVAGIGCLVLVAWNCGALPLLLDRSASAAEISEELAEPADAPPQHGSGSQVAAAPPQTKPSPADLSTVPRFPPLVILGVGMGTVLLLIIGGKIHPFIALTVAAMLVSMLAAGWMGQGNWATSISRVAAAFGTSAGNIGIVIGMAAVIGKCMLDSGAADRIVRSFLRLFGEKRASIALMGSGFVLAVPVFFDTVFYLLVPLARSLYRRTQRNYLLYVLAIGGGGAITHTLVPPTPGPLVMATTLGFDVGLMILVGGLVALPAAVAALVFAHFANHWMPVPMRSIGDQPEPEPLEDSQLPSLWISLLPVVLPVLLISANTIVETSAKAALREQLVAAGVERPRDDQLTQWMRSPERIENSRARTLAGLTRITNVVGNANFALLLSAAIAIATLVRQRQLSRTEMATAIETALMSGGVIILITAAGGAFGEMLKVAQVGDAIQQAFTGIGGAGKILLVLGFAIAAVLKIAQGSSTVAMITGSAMLAGIAAPETLGFSPVYLATAIGGGSLVGSWMNDSGFWIFAKMSGLTEVEALKSWTIMLVVLATVSLVVTILLSSVLPLV
jgi:gluconate:H+ symporter, GntP family